MPRDPRRPDRVAEAVREEIAALLAGGVKDPRVSALVTVTGVEMSRDLGHATVYVSVYGSDRERDETMAGLDAITSRLQRSATSATRANASITSPALRSNIEPTMCASVSPSG